MAPRIRNEGLHTANIDNIINAIDSAYEVLPEEMRKMDPIVVGIFFENRSYGPISQREAAAIKATYTSKKVGFADVRIFRMPPEGYVSKDGEVCYSVALYKTTPKPEPINNDNSFQSRII